MIVVMIIFKIEIGFVVIDIDYGVEFIFVMEFCGYGIMSFEFYRVMFVIVSRMCLLRLRFLYLVFFVRLSRSSVFIIFLELFIWSFCFLVVVYGYFVFSFLMIVFVIVFFFWIM